MIPFRKWHLPVGTLVLSVLLALAGCGGGGGNPGPAAGPSVVATSPLSAATEVPIAATISAQFDSDMNVATIDNTTFTVNSVAGPVSGTVRYDNATRTATFTPNLDLPPLTPYTVTLSSSIKCADNTALSPYSWSFTTKTGFWAWDFSTSSNYFLNAQKVAEGIHCKIYIEQGQYVSQADIDAIKNEFDVNIYPKEIIAYGNEPNPGIDRDAKIYILLTNIPEPTGTGGSYYGYFIPVHEYDQNSDPHTNMKEMFYININPAQQITLESIYNTLAHEFQHMIHWEQKYHIRNLPRHEETWLDEAMSEVARTYCGYGPNYERVLLFEQTPAPAHSLTNWDGLLASYAPVYMWGQYFRDNYSADIFKRMINSNSTGSTSVDNALASIGSPKDYTATFRDWSIAVLSGNAITYTSHPEWSYTSINTWPGTYADNVKLQGLFGSANTNVVAPGVQDMWSVAYYRYTPTTPPIGSVAWNPASSTLTASFLDNGNGLLYSSMTPSNPYAYDTTGYLIIQNPTGSPMSSGDSVTYNSLSPSRTAIASVPGAPSGPAIVKSPEERLALARKDPLLKKLAEATGRPQAIDVGWYFREKEAELRAKGARPPF